MDTFGKVLNGLCTASTCSLVTELTQYPGESRVLEQWYSDTLGTLADDADLIRFQVLIVLPDNQ